MRVQGHFDPVASVNYTDVYSYDDDSSFVGWTIAKLHFREVTKKDD